MPLLPISRRIEPPQREPKTYTAYKYCLELFQAHCTKTYIQDVTREDVLAFIRKLYEMGCGAHGVQSGGHRGVAAESERD